MTENRRGINLWNSAKGTSGQDFDLTIKSMEDQLRISNELASAERERQLALEKTREQQELIGREAEGRLQLLRSEVSDSGYVAAIERGTNQIVEAENAFTEMRYSSEKFTTSTGSGLKSLFGTLFKGELSSAKDLWDIFCNSLVKSWASAVARMAAHGLEDLLGNLFGWLSGGGIGFGGGSSGSFDNSSQINAALAFHAGGIVGRDGTYRTASPFIFAGAPRLHSGLASDEFPAILQRGETVIPRGKSGYGGQSAQALNVHVSLDNQSSTPLKMEQNTITRDLDKIVVGIVIKDIEQYGPIGQMIKNRR